MRPLLLLPVLALFFAGCAARHTGTHWTLHATPDGHVLAPPALPTHGSVKLAAARSTKSNTDCSIDTPEIALAFSGHAARLKVRWNGVQQSVEGGTVVQDLNWWTRFTEALDAREHNDCLAPGEAEPLHNRILDSVAMHSGTLYNLRYGNTAISGYLDLTPQFLLKSIEPVPGSQQREFETVYYGVSARREGGVGLSVTRATREREGKVRSLRHPGLPVITLGRDARFIRYFFRNWKLASGRRIAVLAATRRELLDPLTHKFEADPDAVCASLAPAEGTCVAVPNDSVIAPEINVRVNGRRSSVPVGSTVGAVLFAAKIYEPDRVLATLRVDRPYNGHLRPIDFDAKQPTILQVVLSGSEDVRW